MKKYQCSKIGVISTILMFVALAVKIIITYGIDSDTWFILNNGRYLLENGIPYINPFSIHEGLPIVLSQPLTSVLLYLVYQYAGYIGILIWVIVFAGITVLLTYKLMKTSPGVTTVTAFALTVLISFAPLCSFWKSRPQLITACLLLWELVILNKYQQSISKTASKIILWLPVISLLSINFHGSFYVTIYLPILAYIVGDMISLHGQKIKLRLSKKVINLIILLPIMFLVGLLNPYGIDGILYLFHSIGDATKYNIIRELAVPKLVSLRTVFYLFEIVIGILQVVSSYKKREFYPVNLYHILLWAGGNLLFPMAIRNLLLSTIFAIPLMSDFFAEHYNKFLKIEKAFRELCSYGKWKIISMILGIYTMICCVQLYPAEWNPKDCYTTPIEAVKYLNHARESENIERVYTGFNNGAYLEWNSYKAYIDARPELYETKDKEIYSEYVTVYRSQIDPTYFLNKYRFDYLIIGDESCSSEAVLRYHVMNNPSWSPVLYGNGYVLWKYQ